MEAKTRKLIELYVHENIDTFHARRIEKIKSLKLNAVLESKNPYLFRAKNLNRASDLVTALLDARLSSGEETSFGGFLEELAIYVAEETGGGVKSSTQGIDIELTRKKIRYLIAVKSGQNWGNADQHRKLRENFRNAVKVLRQSRRVGELRPTEGICYGKFAKPDRGLRDKGDYIRVIGQSFWYLISGDRELYVDMIEPLGHEAEAHSKRFEAEKDATYNRLTDQFMSEFCGRDYKIDWPRLARFVSENLPPITSRKARRA